jgi:hypothetical protein
MFKQSVSQVLQLLVQLLDLLKNIVKASVFLMGKLIQHGNYLFELRTFLVAVNKVKKRNAIHSDMSVCGLVRAPAWFYINGFLLKLLRD